MLWLILRLCWQGLTPPATGSHPLTFTLTVSTPSCISCRVLHLTLLTLCTTLRMLPWLAGRAARHADSAGGPHLQQAGHCGGQAEAGAVSTADSYYEHGHTLALAYEHGHALALAYEHGHGHMSMMHGKHQCM